MQLSLKEKSKKERKWLDVSHIDWKVYGSCKCRLHGFPRRTGKMPPVPYAGRPSESFKNNNNKTDQLFTVIVPAFQCCFLFCLLIIMTDGTLGKRKKRKSVDLLLWPQISQQLSDNSYFLLLCYKTHLSSHWILPEMIAPLIRKEEKCSNGHMVYAGIEPTFKYTTTQSV